MQLWADKSIFDEKEILGRLPQCLSDPVLEFLYEDIMGSAALFTQLTVEEISKHGREIIRAIALELHNQVCSVGMVAMQEGTLGTSMYLLRQTDTYVIQIP